MYEGLLNRQLPRDCCLWSLQTKHTKWSVYKKSIYTVTLLNIAVLKKQIANRCQIWWHFMYYIHHNTVQNQRLGWVKKINKFSVPALLLFLEIFQISFLFFKFLIITSSQRCLRCWNFVSALQMHKTHFRVVLWSQEGPTFQNINLKSASSFLDIIHNIEYLKCGIKSGYLEQFLAPPPSFFSKNKDTQITASL